MIYIFDDRATRAQRYEDTIKKYRNSVSFAKFDIESEQQLNGFLKNNFKDGDCVLFHKSYVFKDKDIKLSSVKDTLTGRGVRFGVFSGGIERGSVSNDGTVNINADVMYENMDLFLRNLNETGELNFDILIWGENYRLNKLLSLRNEIFKNIFIDVDMNEIIPDIDIDDVYEDVENRFGDVGFEIDIREIVDNTLKSRRDSVSWDDLFTIIQAEIDKLEA